MKCPYCDYNETKVTDSRNAGRYVIRRRRECVNCSKRFTTYERLETTPIYVIKKDERREKFDREKLKKGLMKAVEKRPVDIETVDRIVNTVEDKIRGIGDREVKSSVIGEFVMDLLKEIDEVAYIRFASVYRSFADVTSFEDELKKLVKK